MKKGTVSHKNSREAGHAGKSKKMIIINTLWQINLEEENPLFYNAFTYKHDNFQLLGWFARV